MSIEAYLDISHQLEIMELVARLNREENITILMVLHDINHLSVEPIQSLVLDPEEGFMQFGMAKKLAESLNGEYVHLKVNSSQVLGSTVREFLR
ncbi:MAG: hypothetical protein ACI3XG_12210 [Faecousia sp.]